MPTERDCPLCARKAQWTDDHTKRCSLIECEHCTMFEIAEGIEKKLDKLPIVEKVILADAARHRTHRVRKDLWASACLKLCTEQDCTVTEQEERAFQVAVKPLVDYLRSKHVEVTGAYVCPVVFVEVDRGRTVKVEEKFFVERSPEEIRTYCEDFDLAGKLAERPAGKSLEIDKDKFPEARRTIE